MFFMLFVLKRRFVDKDENALFFEKMLNSTDYLKYSSSKKSKETGWIEYKSSPYYLVICFVTVPLKIDAIHLYDNSYHHHHHHHVMPLARISLTISRHFSLSFIASGRSSGLHPVSSQSCWMYVRVGRPAFARPGHITYELVPASPAVSCMSGSSNLDSFRDGR